MVHYLETKVIFHIILEKQKIKEDYIIISVYSVLQMCIATEKYLKTNE